jgi:uncharacterized protein YndB with AHSA1/START domain
MLFICLDVCYNLVMQKIHFSIEIDAPKEKVWHAMLDDATYREWTKAFSPGGYFKGDWSEGSKILFLGPDPQTGEEGGLVSEVVENKPYEYLSLKHIGIIQNSVEDTTSDEARKWTPAFENYTFTEKDGKTEVQVDMETAEELIEEFEKMWPEGLKNLKEIAEQS